MSRRQRSHGSSQQLVVLGSGGKSIESLAEDVAIERGTVVATTMFHLAAIRSLQTMPATGKDALVHCAAARLQDKGAKYGQQAAHLLPGQIMVAGVPVWRLAHEPYARPTNEAARLAAQTMACFSLTRTLPALFNLADSEAEGQGHHEGPPKLKWLFADAVKQLWQRADVGRPGDPAVDCKAALAALQKWFDDVNVVYEAAARRKAERGRLDEARALQVYARSFKVASPRGFVLSRLPAVYQRYR